MTAMPTIFSPLGERNVIVDSIRLPPKSPAPKTPAAIPASPRSALKLPGTPDSRSASRRVSFDNFGDHILQLPERRQKFSFPTPPANRLIKRVPGSFEVLSTTDSPTGEEVAFGIFSTLRESSRLANITDADTEVNATATIISSSPKPQDGRVNEHLRFAEDGTTETARNATWVASTLLKNIGGEQAPTLTLWHECDSPSKESAEWSAEEWAVWDRGQWDAWEEAQAEEWADAEWEAEWDDEEAGALSPSTHTDSISTPDSAKEVRIFGEDGRLQRERGATPNQYKGEGRVILYGVRLAATPNAATPSGSARARKFTKMKAAARDTEGC